MCMTQAWTQVKPRKWKIIILGALLDLGQSLQGSLGVWAIEAQKNH